MTDRSAARREPAAAESGRGRGARIDLIDDLPKEECGVFAVVAPGRDVSRLAFYALHALQHRGQESAGIAVSDEGQVTVQRDLGLVSGVFDEPSLRSLTGGAAIGHVRYSTTGGNKWDNAQPVTNTRNGGLVALGHNGNLTNTGALRDQMTLAAARTCRRAPTRRSSPRCSPPSRAACCRPPAR